MDKTLISNIWNQFKSILMLIEQIQKSSNKPFQVILIKAKIGLFNNGNVAMSYSKVVTKMHIQNIPQNSVLVQWNTTQYTINRL